MRKQMREELPFCKIHTRVNGYRGRNRGIYFLLGNVPSILFAEIGFSDKFRKLATECARIGHRAVYSHDDFFIALILWNCRQFGIFCSTERKANEW